MDIKEERNQLHSALADLVTFLEDNPHPMQAAISVYMKDAINAIQNSTIGEEETSEVIVSKDVLSTPMIEKLKYDVDDELTHNDLQNIAKDIYAISEAIPEPSKNDDQMVESVVLALKALGYKTREATNLAVSVTGDTVEERLKNALISTTTMRPSHGSD